MSQKALMILPMIGMVLLTVIVSVRLIQLRYRAVLQDGVNPAYFKLNKGAKLPDYLVKVTQHYENLFETPLLFYVGVLLVLVLNQVDTLYIILAWAFLFSRIAHAYIHIGNNKIRLRRNSFLLSYLVIIILWIRIAVDLVMT